MPKHDKPEPTPAGKYGRAKKLSFDNLGSFGVVTIGYEPDARLPSPQVMRSLSLAMPATELRVFAQKLNDLAEALESL